MTVFTFASSPALVQLMRVLAASGLRSLWETCRRGDEPEWRYCAHYESRLDHRKCSSVDGIVSG